MSLIKIIASICLFIFKLMCIIQLFEHFEVHEGVLEKFDCQEVLLVSHIVIEYDLSLLFLSEDIFKKFGLLSWGHLAKTPSIWGHWLHFIAFFGVRHFSYTLTSTFWLNHWLSLVSVLYIQRGLVRCHAFYLNRILRNQIIIKRQNSMDTKRFKFLFKF